MKYIDRDISWMHFNERVMQEAQNKDNPLLERLKFLGIYSNNQDDFFRTHVGSLQLSDIIVKAVELRKNFEETYIGIVNELRENNIVLVQDIDSLSDVEKNKTRAFFRDNVCSYLFPLLLDKVNGHTLLNEYLPFLCVEMRDNNNNLQYAILEIPTQRVPRFFLLSDDDDVEKIMFLDDVIRICLPDIFAPLGYNTFEAYSFEIIRNAEVDLDTSRDPLDVITDLIHLRKQADVIMLIRDKAMPERMLKHLLKHLDIGSSINVDTVTRYLNNRDFMNFPNVSKKKELKYTDQHSIQFVKLHDNVLQLVQEHDLMLHFPYHSFLTLIDLLREASIDPAVKEIKMTVYRVSENTPIINALINASRNGKKVSVYVEVKARFDEINNLQWVTRLKNEGVVVMNILPDYKVHAKIIWISTIKNNQENYFALIGTGNPNEDTAKTYADTMLCTSDKSICKEVNKVFKIINNRLSFPDFEHLFVSPINLRYKFIELINNEIENAKKSLPASIILKLNTLSDKQLIDKLYDASECGVKIDLIVRGICCLNPDYPTNKNISAISIVDRYLEHSRFYVFENAGKPLYYMGSADFVKNKIDERIEVVTPINDEFLQTEIKDLLRIYLTDNTHSRLLSYSKINQYQTNEQSPICSQQAIAEYLKESQNK